MKPKRTRPVVVLLLMLVSLFNPGPARPGAVVHAQVGPDLYMKDTPADTGVEPNPDPGPMWVSEDIWVRTSPDPNYSPFPFAEASPPWTPLPHENPEYRDPQYSTPNYVYVRVRNRGTAPSLGTERLRLYFAKAGTGLSWPTQWVDNVVGNTLYGMEITKTRKNVGNATAAERDAYRDAILDIGTDPALVFAGGSSYWHKQDEVHQFGPANRHGSPAFLPWHREMVNRYEALLQESNPTVKLLYWDWTTDPENTTGGFNIFTNTFMGASGSGAGSASIGAPFLPALSPPAVTRDLGGSFFAPSPSPADGPVLAHGLYDNFGPDLESSRHDNAHVYVGGNGGNMSSISTATEDPFFYMLHANADRLWAQWQRDTAALSRLVPATAYDGDSANANITGSMGPWDGTGVAIQPWTVADGYIVTKTPQDASVVSPPFYDTAPLVVPALQPGEAVVLEIPWYPPDPADFASFGDPGHFCMLARIETSTTAPFGMTFAEGADVSTNTRNNNNIAWKNITVVDDFAGALRLTSILIRNVFTVPVATGLRFLDVGGDNDPSFFDFGRIYVELGQELYDRWVEGGAAGQGIERVGGTRLQILSPDAFIQGIPLGPGETFPVGVQFELDGDYRPTRRMPRWDLVQVGAPGDPQRLVGGQRFEVDLSRLVPAPAGGDWRYLDGGRTPGAGWTEPGYDDSGWKQGQAELGFGNSPVTMIDGGPPDHRHTAAYFRRTFEVDDPALFHSLFLRLKRNDGAVVYLNGVEVHRANMPAGAVGPETLATQAVEGLERKVFFPVEVDPALLKEGENVIAAEVHLHAHDSPDLSFDLELYGNPAAANFPPDVAFASPADGALFQIGHPIPVEVEALDADGEVAEVALYAGDALIGADGQGPYSFVWAGAPLGLHLLRAVTTDGDGEQAEAQITVSVVENTPPLIELTLPADGAAYHEGEPVVAEAAASDPGGEVARVEFRWSDGERFGAEVHMLAAERPPFRVTLPALAPGHYHLSAVAVDEQGERSQSIPVHIMVEGHDHEPSDVYLPHIMLH